MTDLILWIAIDDRWKVSIKIGETSRRRNLKEDITVKITTFIKIKKIYSNMFDSYNN